MYALRWSFSLVLLSLAGTASAAPEAVPSERSPLRRCPLVGSWQDLDVGTAKKTITLGGTSYDLSDEGSRMSLERLASACGASVPEKKWSKKLKTAVPVAEDAAARMREVVQADQTWLRSQGESCSTQKRLDSCLSVSEAAASFPAWLRRPEDVRVSTSGRAQALQLTRSDTAEAVKKCTSATASAPNAVDAAAITLANTSCEAAKKQVKAYEGIGPRLQVTKDEMPEGAAHAKALDTAAGALERYARRKEFLDAHGLCVKDGAESACATVEKLSALGTSSELSAGRQARQARVEKETRERLQQEQAEREARDRAAKTEGRSREILPQAELCAKTEIYNQLRSPSTASFTAELTDRDDFCYAFYMKVDAQNGFGAYIRKNYCVFVKMTDPWDPKPTHFYGTSMEESTAALFGMSLRQACTNKASAVCDRK